jgi:hypothetical protein
MSLLDEVGADPVATVKLCWPSTRSTLYCAFSVSTTVAPSGDSFDAWFLNHCSRYPSTESFLATFFFSPRYSHSPSPVFVAW